MLHVACLISGTGSNLKRLIQHVIHSDLDTKVKIDLVISNKKNAYGLNHARDNNITDIVIPFRKPNNYKDLDRKEKQKIRDEYDFKLLESLVNHKINIVYCLGWNMILGSRFIQACEDKNIKLINLHPSLPGDDKLIGLNSVDRAYNQYLGGERVITGTMVHNIIADVDKGRPIYWDSLDISKCKNKEEYLLKINMVEKKVVIMAFDKLIDELSSI